MEWRLFSPSAKPLSCEIEQASDGFVLRVTRDGALLFTAQAPEAAPLRERAQAWRTSLESNGYSPFPAGRARPDGRPSELRAALRGLVECSAVLEMHDPAAARDLRDRATQGLAALALCDHGALREAIEGSRAALARMPGTTAGARDLIASAHALLDRIEAAPEYASPAAEPRNPD